MGYGILNGNARQTGQIQKEKFTSDWTQTKAVADSAFPRGDEILGWSVSAYYLA